MASWRKLAQGIGATAVLKKLKFNRINFERDQVQLEVLVDALSRNDSIESLDLSCNDLTDRYGSLVAQCVQSQIEMRDEYKWAGALRIGRRPSADITNRGLKEFILGHNRLGSNFIQSLSRRLKDDQYLKFVDLKFNRLNSDLIMTMLKTLDSNQYLAGLDLRGNKGYADNVGVQQALSQFLQRNLSLNLKANEKLKSTWIVKDEIFLKDAKGEPLLDGAGAILAENLHRTEKRSQSRKRPDKPRTFGTSFNSINTDLPQLGPEDLYIKQPVNELLLCTKSTRPDVASNATSPGSTKPKAPKEQREQNSKRYEQLSHPMGCLGLRERCAGPQHLSLATEDLRPTPPPLDNEFSTSSRLYLDKMSILNKRASLSSLTKRQLNGPKHKRSKSDLYLMCLRRQRFQSVDIDQELDEYEKTLQELGDFDKKARKKSIA